MLIVLKMCFDVAIWILWRGDESFESIVLGVYYCDGDVVVEE
jgi:hypothetical protein